MTTFTDVTVEQFRSEAGQFFREVSSGALSIEQVRNGSKCLTLLYLGHADNWTDWQRDDAVTILTLAMREAITAEVKDLER